MNGITATIEAETSSQSVGSEALGDFRIHWPNQVAESLHGILLSDFQCDAGTSRHLLCHLWELGQHTLINLKELLRCRPVQVEHLHGANLEALVQDGINDLTCVASLDRMGLDHGARAIREHGT